MQITIFGATGKVGRIITQLALEKGHSVTAFVHSARLSNTHQRLLLAAGDIYDAQVVSDALKGSEAVICTLGSWGTPGKDILTTGMKHIIPAMEAQGIKKIVSLTGSDAEATGDSRDFIHRSLRPIEQLVAGKVLRDGEAHIALLEKSNLDWSTVRSPAMNNLGNTGSYTLSSSRPMPWRTVNRTSVATAMFELLEGNEWVRKAPYVTRG